MIKMIIPYLEPYYSVIIDIWFGMARGTGGGGGKDFLGNINVEDGKIYFHSTSSDNIYDSIMSKQLSVFLEKFKKLAKD